MSLYVAAGAAALLAVTGARLRWLSAPGALAAAAVGTLVFWGAGVAGAVLLAFFFLSGSLLDLGDGSRAAPPRRNAAQVLANGGVAAVAATLIGAGTAAWPILVGALAAAQADTWATEIGRRRGGVPVLITTRTPVAPGTSGGVTGVGTWAGAIGALALAAVALASGVPWPAALAAIPAGIGGSAFDSWLGATVQARFRCGGCGTTTEAPAAHCAGRRMTLERGIVWVDNDVVNLAATVVGGVLGCAVAWLLS